MFKKTQPPKPTLEATLMKALHQQQMIQEEISDIRTSIVTLKLALGAVLQVREKQHLDLLPQDKQHDLHTMVKHQKQMMLRQAPLVKHTTTSTAPVAAPVVTQTASKPKRTTVKKPNANAAWTKASDRELFRLKRDGYSNHAIAKILGRSESSVKQRVTKIGKK
jgi:DNA-binding NarL/FixJ family response regulator